MGHSLRRKARAAMKRSLLLVTTHLPHKLRRSLATQGLLIAWLVVTLLLLPSLALAVTNEKPLQVKYGTLTTSETWENDIYLVGDVTVPEGMTLTILPGTRLHFGSEDILAAGRDPTQCEIIVQGNIEAKHDPKNPIQVMTATRGKSLEKLALDPHTRVLKFYPYEVKTETLRQEFRSFKNQYLLFWSVIYGIFIFLR